MEGLPPVNPFHPLMSGTEYAGRHGRMKGFSLRACGPGHIGARRGMFRKPTAGTYDSVATTYGAWEDGMVHAYILVQTEVGKAADVAVHIAQIPGVTQADDVTGPYDVIVRAEADNVDDLGKLVVAQIQGVAGITRTLTCPIVHI
jgi:DNA-binding Lrp family transcriptional regulator